MKNRRLHLLLCVIATLGIHISTYGNLLPSQVLPCKLFGNSDTKTAIKLEVLPNTDNDSVIVFYSANPIAMSQNPLINKHYALEDIMDGGDAVVVYKNDPTKLKTLTVDVEAGKVGYFKAYSFKPAPQDSVVYSAIAVSYTGRTALEVPYTFDMETEVAGKPLAGWNSPTNTFSLTTSGLSDLTYPCISKYNGKQLVVKVFPSEIQTPVMFLGEQDLRIWFNYNFFASGRGGITGPKNFTATDSLKIEMSKDLGETWEVVFVLDEDNAQINTTGLDSEIFFDVDEKVEKGIFRFTAKAGSGSLMTISNIRFMAKPSCEYPYNIKLTENSLTHNSVSIEYTDINSLDADYCIVKYGEEILKVETNPFVLNNLQSNKSYTISMRSQCTASTASDSSLFNPQVVSFTTMPSLPLTENFMNYSEDCNSYKIADGYTRYNQEIGTSDMLATSLKPIAGSKGSTWSLKPKADGESAEYVCAISKAASFAQTLMSPKIHLGQQGSSIILSMKMYFTPMSTGAPLDTLKGNAGVYLLYSPDGGTTWNRDSAIAAWDKDHLSMAELLDTNTKTFEITQPENLEKLQIAFFIKAIGSEIPAMPINLVLSDLNIKRSYVPCDTVLNIKPGAGEYTSLKLKWEGSAASYNIAYRKDGSTKEDTIKGIKNTEYTIKNLVYSSKYWVKIQSVCSDNEGDFSPYTNEKAYYTLQLDCATPYDISFGSTSTPIRSLVHWSGGASTNEIRYSTASSDTWTYIYSTVLNITIATAPNTDYKLQVRGFCSTIDTTQWSEVFTFTSLKGDTCYAPLSFNVSDITASSATLAWELEGKTEGVEFVGKKQGSDIFDTKVYVTEDSYIWDLLEQNTGYECKIRNVCGESDTSAWSSAITFNTEKVASENLLQKSFVVYTSAGEIIILNTDDQKLDYIEVLNANGQKISQVECSNSNRISIPLPAVKGLLMLRLHCDKQVLTYKVMNVK